MEQDNLGKAIRQHPVGSLIEATVVHHAHFGVFVEIGPDRVSGLVRIVDFRDDYTMSPEQFPPIGSTIKGIVLGVSSGQINIGMKPAHLALAGL